MSYPETMINTKKNMKRKFILGAYIGLSFRIADDNEVDQS